MVCWLNVFFVSCLGSTLSVGAGVHQWSNFRWPETRRLNGEISVSIGNCLPGSSSVPWNEHFATVMESWSTLLQRVSGFKITIAQECDNADVQVYADNYGATGWLGIARVWVLRDGSIIRGENELNEFYTLNAIAYRHVFCQEVGHTFGLGHQSERGSVDTDSCMDYSWGLQNAHPNDHDAEQLISMYNEAAAPPRLRRRRRRRGGRLLDEEQHGGGDDESDEDDESDVGALRLEPATRAAVLGDVLEEDESHTLYQKTYANGERVFTDVLKAQGRGGRTI